MFSYNTDGILNKVNNSLNNKEFNKKKYLNIIFNEKNNKLKIMRQIIKLK